MPGPRQMLLRGTLLLALLVGWLVLDGIGVGGPSWLAAVGQIGLFLGAGLALVWLVREILPAARRRRRP